jgi:hypothetical protein
MDGWQLLLAPEQAFSLALTQERVGVMQFAAPNEVMVMNFVPVVLGAKGDKGEDSASAQCLAVSLSPSQVLTKQIVLPTTPRSTVLLHISEGTSQKQNVDFIVTGAVLSWAGLSLELLLAAGDYLSISYT